MLYLFVYPPIQQPNSPIIGIPHLIGILKSKNIKAEMLDFNADFSSNILNAKFLKQHNCDVPKGFNLAKYILKNKHLFFNPFLNFLATNSFCKGLNTIFNPQIAIINDILPGAKNFFSDDINPCSKMDIEKVLLYINSDENILRDYFERKTNEIINKKPNCVGISINTDSQLLYGLSIAYMIKKKEPNIHINIGGAFFSSFHNYIENLIDIIGLFCDTISISHNDSTIYELIRYLKNEQQIENVPNIVYKKDNKLLKTDIKNENNISELPFQSFDGYVMSDYFVPKVVLPIRASYSCYWNKCIFCICSKESNFQIKKVEDVFAELKYLSEKYKTKYFYFWDNALPPEFLEKFADLVIEKKLNIKFSFYARFEKNFTKNLLSKLKKAGCLKINWGLESASEEVINFVKKGISIKNAERILKDSHSVGISNFVCFILGLPSETKNDIEKTKEFLRRNRNIIDVIEVAPEVFFLDGTIMTQSKLQMQEKINTSLEARKEYAKQIAKIFPPIRFWNYTGVYNLLFLGKYSYTGLKICNNFFEFFFKIISRGKL